MEDKFAKQLTKAAIVYDFDGTLARGNLQECSFIPKMNMTRTEFWNEVKRRTREEDADEILVYMHLMLERRERLVKWLPSRCCVNTEWVPSCLVACMEDRGSSA